MIKKARQIRKILKSKKKSHIQLHILDLLITIYIKPLAVLCEINIYDNSLKQGYSLHFFDYGGYQIQKNYFSSDQGESKFISLDEMNECLKKYNIENIEVFLNNIIILLI